MVFGIIVILFQNSRKRVILSIIFHPECRLTDIKVLNHSIQTSWKCIPTCKDDLMNTKLKKDSDSIERFIKDGKVSFKPNKL